MRACLSRQVLAAVLAAAVALPAAGRCQPEPPTSDAVALPAAPAPPEIRPDQAAVILEALAAADAQGFAPHAFDAGDAGAQLASPDPQTRADAALELKAAALAYARAQHGGRMEGRFPANWAIRPAPYDGEAEFIQALTQDRVDAWLQALAPAEERYRRLVSAYGRYREIVARGGWPVLSPGPLQPGSKGERVAALRARLAVEDPWLTSQPAPAATIYDATLFDAVVRAQARYGLNTTGAADAALISALNAPAETRLAQIAANLERWRWVPRSLPPDRLELNIAGAWLDVYQAGQVTLSMRAIVGRPHDPTPSFQDQVETVLFNPPWNIPPSIAANEIWPKARRNRGYLSRRHMVVKPDGSIQQLPGPDNALGMVKFDLPNPFDVYLHDTPSKRLFDLEVRTLSHGCMRLQQPMELAKLLLKDDPNWPAEQIETAMRGGPTTRVPLAKPVPVFVFYWTAFVDDQGQVNFRPDVYRWDDALLALLQAG